MATEAPSLFEPPPLLAVRLSDDTSNPSYRCLCPGFELKKWRFEQLAANLIDWLPDFAIRHDELPPGITNISEFRKLLEKAARRLYDTKKTDSRGEIGELLLHIACREVTGTFPAVSKVYYKTASNDVVKGFDLVHTRYVQDDDELEMWLGEAKFYTSGADAVAASIKSISDHLDAGFLTAEKFLLGGKVSRDTPGYHKLEWLFERDTPLDEIFKRLVIPILITFESENCSVYCGDEQYDCSLMDKLRAGPKNLHSSLGEVSA